MLSFEAVAPHRLGCTLLRAMRMSFYGAAASLSFPGRPVATKSRLCRSVDCHFFRAALDAPKNERIVVVRIIEGSTASAIAPNLASRPAILRLR
jgi:hypothetical protein